MVSIFLRDLKKLNRNSGLAFNTIGGALVWIESVVIPVVGNGKATLKTTGKLGDVMKESTDIAFTFAKKFSHELSPQNDFFEKNSIHMHFPEGGVSKDGPSVRPDKKKEKEKLILFSGWLCHRDFIPLTLFEQAHQTQHSNDR